MTTEDKQILIQDLCARLPYGVKIKYHYKRENNVIDEVRELDFSDVETLKYNNEYPQDNWCEISWKPYLRKMSSMTTEEYNEYQELYDYEERSYNQGCDFYDEWKVEINDEERLFKIADWLNAHHFDYRELIEKGLALPAPEDMYE